LDGWGLEFEEDFLVTANKRRARRRTALNWKSVRQLPGSDTLVNDLYEAREGDYYFTYDGKYKELDWMKGSEDFYYDGHPSLEEAKQIAEKVVPGSESGTKMSKKAKPLAKLKNGQK